MIFIDLASKARHSTFNARALLPILCNEMGKTTYGRPWSTEIKKKLGNVRTDFDTQKTKAAYNNITDWGEIAVSLRPSADINKYLLFQVLSLYVRTIRLNKMEGNDLINTICNNSRSQVSHIPYIFI